MQHFITAKVRFRARAKCHATRWELLQYPRDRDHSDAFPNAELRVIFYSTDPLPGGEPAQRKAMMEPFTILEAESATK